MYALQDASEIFEERGQRRQAKLAAEAFAKARAAFKNLDQITGVLDNLIEEL